MNTMSARFPKNEKYDNSPQVGSYNPVLPEHSIAINFGKQQGRYENPDKFVFLHSFFLYI